MVKYDSKNETEEYVTAVPITVPVIVPQVPVPQLDISDDMIKTYNYRRSVMWFSGIDIFFSAYLLFVSTLFSYSVVNSINWILWS